MFGMEIFSAKAGKSSWLEPQKKAFRIFHDYIWYFKLHNYIKNRGFWEFLEQIKARYRNRDEHSYIRVDFRKLHSEKKHSDNSVRKNYTEFITFILLAQETINMNNI